MTEAVVSLSESPVEWASRSSPAGTLAPVLETKAETVEELVSAELVVGLLLVELFSTFVAKVWSKLVLSPASATDTGATTSTVVTRVTMYVGRPSTGAEVAEALIVMSWLEEVEMLPDK